MRAIARKSLILAAGVALLLPAAGCGPSAIEPSAFDQVAPQISGKTIAWEDSRNDASAGTDVYSYNTATATESLVAGGSGEQDQPGVSDRYFVWIDDGKLRAKDRSSGNMFRVTSGPATQADPALCGSVVVWTDTSNNSDVYAKDLAGGATVPVATSAATEAYPACD